MRSSPLCFSFSFKSRSQYSSAALGSWIEQGPMMTRSRSFGSVPLTTATASSRLVMTVALDSAVWGISCWSRSGGVRGL